MNLIGPVSLFYYDKIQIEENDFRNILLLGDFHESFYFNPSCCNNKKISREIDEFYYSILGCYNKFLLINVLLGTIEILNDNDLIKINYQVEQLKKFLYNTSALYNIIPNVKHKKMLEFIIKNINFENKKLKIITVINDLIYDTKIIFTDNMNLLKSKLHKNVDNRCVLLHNFIYNLSVNNDCIDYYVELYRLNLNEMYIDEQNSDYLSLCFMLFHLIKYLKKYNTDFEITNFFSNIRVHESDIRIHDDDIYKIIGKINKKFVKTTEDIIYYYNNYINQYLFNFLKYGTLNDENNSYYIIFNEYPTKIKEILIKQLNLIHKQYKKSILYEKHLEKIINIILKIANINSDLIAAKDNNIESFIFCIEILIINIYSLFRMMIKKEKWINKKHLQNNNCDKYSYPKNILCSYGQAHVLWLKKFINLYFDVSPQLEIDDYNDSHVIENDKYEKIRCIKLPINYKFFD
jgi:hypothetical protein